MLGSSVDGRQQEGGLTEAQQIEMGGTGRNSVGEVVTAVGRTVTACSPAVSSGGTQVGDGWVRWLIISPNLDATTDTR